MADIDVQLEILEQEIIAELVDHFPSIKFALNVQAHAKFAEGYEDEELEAHYRACVGPDAEKPRADLIAELRGSEFEEFACDLSTSYEDWVTIRVPPVSEDYLNDFTYKIIPKISEIAGNITRVCEITPVAGTSSGEFWQTAREFRVHQQPEKFRDLLRAKNLGVTPEEMDAALPFKQKRKIRC